MISGLIAAITWPAALISAAGVIDNPWHVCTQRSEAVGKQLAEVLLAREQVSALIKKQVPYYARKVKEFGRAYCFGLFRLYVRSASHFCCKQNI